MALSKYFKWSHLSPKESNYMQGLISAILAIFQKGTGWSCPVSAALKNPSQDFKNSLCFWFLAMLEGKIRVTLFFKAQSGKITVCGEWGAEEQSLTSGNGFSVFPVASIIAPDKNLSQCIYVQCKHSPLPLQISCVLKVIVRTGLIIPLCPIDSLPQNGLKYFTAEPF